MQSILDKEKAGEESKPTSYYDPMEMLSLDYALFPYSDDTLGKVPGGGEDGDGGGYNNVTIHELSPTTLRFNEHYVLLYKNVANFLLTMVVPFTLLVFYNCRIIGVLRRRQRLINRPIQAPNSRSSQLKVQEARKSYVLLAITVLFMTCHSVRFVLGIHECYSVRDYQAGVRNHCNPSPLWVLVLQSVSNLLLTLNSSLCSILYCLTSRDFQNELKTHYAWLKEQVSPSEERHIAQLVELELQRGSSTGGASGSAAGQPGLPCNLALLETQVVDDLDNPGKRESEEDKRSSSSGLSGVGTCSCCQSVLTSMVSMTSEGSVSTVVKTTTYLKQGTGSCDLVENRTIYSQEAMLMRCDSEENSGGFEPLYLDLLRTDSAPSEMVSRATAISAAATKTRNCEEGFEIEAQVNAVERPNSLPLKTTSDL